MKQETKAFFILVFAVTIWGGSFLPTKWLLHSISVYEFLFYRFLFASLAFFVITYKSVIKHYKNTYLYGLLTGVCMAMAFILQTLALPLTQSSNVAFLTGLEGITAPFLCALINKRSLTIRAIICAFVACFGMFLFSDANIDNFGSGEWLAIGCAIFFGLLVTLNDRFLKNNDLNTFVFFQFVGCAIVCLFANIIIDELTLKPISDIRFIGYILISALIFTVFCFFAQNYAQKYLSPSKVALILLLEPISAGALGFCFGEVFTILQLVGAGLILLALAFS